MKIKNCKKMSKIKKHFNLSSDTTLRNHFSVAEHVVFDDRFYNKIAVLQNAHLYKSWFPLFETKKIP